MKLLTKYKKIKVKWILLVLSSIFMHQSYAQCNWTNVMSEGYEYATPIPHLVPGSVYHMNPQTAAFAPGAVHSGGSGMYMNIVDGYNGMLYNQLINNLCVGQTYRFSFWTRDAWTGVNNLTVRVLDAFNNVISIQNVINNNVWQNVIMPDFVANTTSIRFQISTNIPGAAGNDVGFDDLSLQVCTPPIINTAFTICDNAVAANLFNELNTTSTAGVWTGPSALTNGSDGTFNPLTNAGGTYTYTVNNGALCFNTIENVVVTVNSCVIPNILGNDTIICEGQIVVLDAQTPGFTNYLWTPNGEITPQITVSQTGWYSVTLSAPVINLIQNGDFNLQATNWSFLGNGTEAYANETSYGGTNAANAVAEIDAGPDGIIGNGDDASLSQNITGLVVGQNYQLCFDYSRRNIAPNPMTINASIQGIVNQNITVTNNVFTWQNTCINFTANSTSQVIVISSFTGGFGGLGMIVDNFTILAPSQIITDSIFVTVIPLPIVDLGPDIVACAGENVILDAQNVGSIYLWSTAENTQQISVNTAGNFDVTVTNANGCVGNDAVTVTMIALPIVNLGPDVIACAGDNIVLDAQNPGLTFLWSTTGNTQQITVNTAGNFSVEVINNDGCVGFDDIEITVNNCNPPLLCNVDLGPNLDLCPGETHTFNLPFAGTYLWDDGSVNPDRTVNTPGTYFVSSTTLGINLIVNGDFELGNTNFNTDYAVGAGGVWGLLSNPGDYVITTSPNLAHNNFNFCEDHTPGLGQNQMVVNGADIPGTNVWCQTVNVTPNTNYQFSTWATNAIDDPNAAILQFNINGNNTGAVFTTSPFECDWQEFFTVWNSGTNTTATICIENQNATGAGNDFCIDDISFQSVCVAHDTVLVTAGVCVLPIILGNDTVVCAGQNVVLDAQTPGFTTYSWQPGGQTTPQITVNQSGSYIVTIGTNTGTNLVQNGGFANQGTNWSFLGNDTEAYANETSYGGANATNAVAEIDSGPDGTSGNGDDASLSQNITGLVVGQNYQLCFDFSRRDIAPNPMTINASIQGIVNQNITATNNVFTWQNTCINFTANATTQVISLTAVTGGFGGLGMIVDNLTILSPSTQVFVDTIQVTVNPAPIVNLGPDQIICLGSSTTLNAQNVGSNYLWSTTEITQQITVNTAGNYSVTVTDTNGCFANDAIIVSIEQPSNAGNDSLSVNCSTENNVDLNTLLSLGSSLLGTWEAITLPAASLTNSIVDFDGLIGTFTTQYIVDGTVCPDDASIHTIIIHSQPIAANDFAQSFCETGGNVDLTAFLNHPNNPNGGTWNLPVGFPAAGLNANTLSPAVIPAGNYALTYELDADSTCVNDMLTYNLEIIQAPDVLFTPNVQNGCAPVEITFTNQSITYGPSTFEWSFGEGATTNTIGNQTHVYPNSGVYPVSLTVVTENLCTVTYNLPQDIEVFSLPIANFNANPQQTFALDPLVNFENTSSNFELSNWNFGDTFTSNQENPTHTFPIEVVTDYEVILIVTSENGCTDTASKVISIKDQVLVFVPNTFTPDGDEFNNVFKPIISSGVDESDFDMKIFNRWGEIIFESFDLNAGWDGTYKESLVKEGVYTWSISYGVLENDRREMLTGHVSILR